MALILLADPDPQVFKIVRFRLTGVGHELVWTKTGLEALDSVSVKHFDLVILELDLPSVDGLQVVNRLVEWQEGRQLPIIVLTSRSSEDDIVAAFRAGVDDYLVKPFSLPELIVRIERSLRRASPSRTTAHYPTTDSFAERT